VDVRIASHFQRPYFTPIFHLFNVSVAGRWSVYGLAKVTALKDLTSVGDKVIKLFASLIYGFSQ